jgi:hypothetical protein
MKQTLTKFAFIFTVLLLAISISCKTKRKANAKKDTPENTKVDTIINNKPIKADFNVYIENSGSMNGYVNTISDFKSTMLKLLSDLKSKDIGSIDISYINDTICPQKINALPEDIRYFYNNLNPQSFRNSGCVTKTSFLSKIIKRAISTDTNEVSILVSDFIFSNNKGTSPEYLEAEGQIVKIFFSEELVKKNRNFSTIMLKLNSQFNGTYYSESARSTKNINVRRPYYIMITGKTEALQTFLEKIDFKTYSGFENSYYLITPTLNNPAAKIVMKDKKGTFEIVKPVAKLSIENAQYDRNKVFQFSFIANLTNLKMDDTYLNNAKNYEIPNNYQIVKIERLNKEQDKSMEGFSHLFTLTTNDLKPTQEVSIKLKPDLPSWVSESSNEDDANPLDSVQAKQTFGFKYLIKGIRDAYTNKYEGKEQFAVHLNISKTSEKSGSNFGVWLLVLVALLVIAFIIIKNKRK